MIMISAIPDEYGSLAPIAAGAEDSALALNIRNANVIAIVTVIVVLM
jgi:hypothetical protein